MSKAEELRRAGKTDEAVFLESQARQIKQLEKIKVDIQEEKKRMSILQHPTDNLEWEIFDGAGNHLIASRNGVPLFEIKRGAALYNLKILHGPTQERYQKTINTASQLTRLKNKADKICKEHYIPFE